ncbi:ATP-binding protein [Collimonas arenae]|nr:ATP-binding protein [Collimonas arenae]
MRSIGYSLESALADLIDNSISAKAKRINIEFRPSDVPYIAIIDDGEGMSKDALESAMRHGSTNPLQMRHKDDMGRYGLGLKTSSLSQCRRMTVVSLRNGVLCAYCWDLDVVVERRSWIMLELDVDDIEDLPHVELLRAEGQGTMVLWQNLDRLTAGESSLDAALGQQMDHARSHLSLVFHRFITPEFGRSRVSLSINQNALAPIDPFLQNHKATQPLDEDNFNVEGSRIVVKPFILPHISKLSPDELNRAGGSDGFRNQQGFYIYRNRRLIIWGTWFRLARKDELSKLARVRVDIPNSLDHLWTLDIKKSAAHPPEAVRFNLRRTIERIRHVSGRTITFRGRSAERGDLVPGWHEVMDRNGVRFDINRGHPSIQEFSRHLAKADAATFDAVLAIIESSFPAEALYSRMASDVRSSFNGEEISGRLREMATALFADIDFMSPVRRTLLATLHLIEPFNQHPAVTKKIVEELEKND